MGVVIRTAGDGDRELVVRILEDYRDALPDLPLVLLTHRDTVYPDLTFQWI